MLQDTFEGLCLFLQNYVISTTLMIYLNNVRLKNIKMKEKTDFAVSLFSFMTHFKAIWATKSYLSDNQQKEKRWKIIAYLVDNEE